MNIAELFVDLGIKGADKTVGALVSVKKGMGDLSSMSLEAKAGILAAMYAVERLMAASGAAGTGFMNFTSLTGIAAKNLQQWQYAARQAGIAGDELAGNLKSVQNTMTNMLLGKGAPEGMAFVKKITGMDLSRARDTLYIMQELQKAAQLLPKDVGNQVLKSFGLSEGVISGMRRNVFTPENFRKAPTYSERELGSLDRANIAWSNLGQKIEMAFGHFNATHGGSLVKDITKITDAVFKLINAVTILSEKLKVFDKLAKLAEVTSQIVEGWSLIVDDLSGKTDDDKRKKGLLLPPGLFAPGTLAHPVFDPTNQGYHLAPPTGGLGPTRSELTQISQTITHYGDAKDTKSVKDLHKNAAAAGINQTFRQRSAQNRGS